MLRASFCVPARGSACCWLAGVLLLAGCASTPQQAATQPVCAVEAGQPVAGKAVLRYQNSAAQSCSLRVPAGSYEVQVVVQWSNGWMEAVALSDDLQLLAGESYSVQASEVGRSTTAVVGARLYPPVTLAQKAVLFTLSAPFIIGPMLLYLPASMLLEDEGPKRPAEDCCHVWLLRESNGEIVAGAAP